MTEKHDTLSEVFGVEPLVRSNTMTTQQPETPSVPALYEPNDSDDEMIRDIEVAKKNVEHIISVGGDSLQEIISLAKQSESPRAFEVASTLMKTLLDANKEFVEMSQKKKERKQELVKKESSTDGSVTNVTNNNLVISTSELLKMIKGETNQ